MKGWTSKLELAKAQGRALVQQNPSTLYVVEEIDVECYALTTYEQVVQKIVARPYTPQLVWKSWVH